jgi:hypothetical protein
VIRKLPECGISEKRILDLHVDVLIDDGWILNSLEEMHTGRFV